jgi:hypothetical protein
MIESCCSSYVQSRKYTHTSAHIDLALLECTRVHIHAPCDTNPGGQYIVYWTRLSAFGVVAPAVGALAVRLPFRGRTRTRRASFALTFALTFAGVFVSADEDGSCERTHAALSRAVSPFGWSHGTGAVEVAAASDVVRARTQTAREETKGA